MKSSQRGASIDGVQKIIFSLLESYSKKIDEICPKIFLHRTVGCASSKVLIRRSQVLLKSEVSQSRGTIIFRKSRCCVFALIEILKYKR